jgi:hypothetical protein
MSRDTRMYLCMYMYRVCSISVVLYYMYCHSRVCFNSQPSLDTTYTTDQPSVKHSKTSKVDISFSFKT